MMLKKKHQVHFSCLWVYTEQMLKRSENRWSLDPESKLKFWHGMLSADAITRIKFLMGHLPGFKASCSSKHEAEDERLLLGFSINKKLNYWLNGVRWLSINDKNSMKKKKDNMKGTSKVNRIILNMYITVYCLPIVGFYVWRLPLIWGRLPDRSSILSLDSIIIKIYIL